MTHSVTMFFLQPHTCLGTLKILNLKRVHFNFSSYFLLIPNMSFWHSWSSNSFGSSPALRNATCYGIPVWKSATQMNICLSPKWNQITGTQKEMESWTPKQKYNCTCMCATLIMITQCSWTHDLHGWEVYLAGGNCFCYTWETIWVKGREEYTPGGKAGGICRFQLGPFKLCSWIKFWAYLCFWSAIFLILENS